LKINYNKNYGNTIKWESISIRQRIDFLSKLSIDKTKGAIELNKSVVPKDKYSVTKLAHKDVVEIVTFIGGG